MNALISTTALAAAAAIPVAALAAPVANAIPPALAAELDEWLAALARWEAISNAEESAVEKHLEERGLTHNDFDRAMQQRLEKGDDRLWAEYQEASDRAYREVMSPERLSATEGGGDRDLTEIQDALWDVCYEILEFRAKTLADLAVQAKAVKHVEPEWWEEKSPPRESGVSYMEGYAGRQLVENILNMAGQFGIAPA